MRRASKRLIPALAALFLAAPAVAADPQVEEARKWTLCAIAGVVYEMAVEDGVEDARILQDARRFKALEPRMEAHANALFARLPPEDGEALIESVLAQTAPWADALEAADVPEAVLAAAGSTMERCLREGAALPEVN